MRDESRDTTRCERRAGPRRAPWIRLGLALAGLWLAVAPSTLRAAPARGDSTEIELSPAGGTTFPIDVRGNLVYLRGRINDSDSLWMVLDSGAGGNALDEKIAGSLGLAIGSGGQARGAGGIVQAGRVYGVTLRLPGATLTNARFGTMPLDAFRLQGGRPMEAILGYPLLSRAVVRVDYLAHTVELLAPEKFEYTGHGTVVPLTFVSGLPYITARLTLPGGRAPIEDRFVIDLGSSQALILSESFVREKRVLDAVPQTIQNRGRGVGGQVQSLAGRVGRLEFAGLKIEQPIAVLRTTRQGTVSAYAGNIGGDILRRFVVIFDYPRQRMILEPNERFGEPFEADMAGIGMRMGPEGSGSVQVEWIQPSSPAAEAGLQPDDLIEGVDDRPALDYGVPGLRDLFRRRSGETHRLSIRRGDTRMEISLTTRRMI